MEIQIPESKESETFETKTLRKKKRASERVKKNIINVIKHKELDIRDISIDPSGNYLITCSEHLQNEKPKILVWNISELLEGDKKPDAILEGQIKNNPNIDIANWFLCIDSNIVKINQEELWIITAGTIMGDVYIWSGKLDPATKEWILNEPEQLIISEGVDKPNAYPKAIFDIKTLKDSINDSLIHIYISLNNIHTIGIHETKDNVVKKLLITINPDGKIIQEETQILGTLSEWITSMDLNSEKNIMAVGSRDGMIMKWNLRSENSNPIIIGKHEDTVSSVKISTDGNKIISGCLDSTIRIWKNNDTNKPDLSHELFGHNDSITSLDVQKNDKYLLSTSKDNTIKVWDLEKGNWIRNIDVDYFIKKYNKKTNIAKKSKMYLKRLKITTDNRFIFISMDNIIIILRNFGSVWHFKEQVKFVKKVDESLYAKIYGENLKQIAKRSPENIDSLKTFYEIIKKRMKKATSIDLALKSHEIESTYSDFNRRELGPLFIPSFIVFETDKKSQKEYILGVKENYDAYWNSVKNSYFKLPDLPWQFKLYITTDVEENILDSNFVEITDPDFKDVVPIIMKDRTQTLVRFLMVLENVPINFIPLLSSINLDVEDDRGDKDNLIFSDFTYSKNYIKVLTNPQDSLKDFRPIMKPESIFYTSCTFQLEEGYSTEAFANIFVRNVAVEYTDNLNPLDKANSDEEIEIFDALKNNFHIPLIPKTQIQIGKGIASTAGKMIDEYFAKIIIVEFIFSFWGFIELGIPALMPGLVIPGIISTIVAISGIAIIGIIFLMMLIKK